ncbi:MAG: fasciclin domain-containing protein [Thioalkalivibrionaceae bacterium]
MRSKNSLIRRSLAVATLAALSIGPISAHAHPYGHDRQGGYGAFNHYGPSHHRGYPMHPRFNDPRAYGTPMYGPRGFDPRLDPRMNRPGFYGPAYAPRQAPMYAPYAPRADRGTSKNYGNATMGGAKARGTEGYGSKGDDGYGKRDTREEKPAAVLGNIPEIADQAGNFSMLLTAVEAAGLAEALTSAGPFTVFAPTDDAFAALPREAVGGLMQEENQAMLARLLQHHVVAGEIKSSDLKDGGTVNSLAETSLAVESRDNAFFVGGGQVIMADIEASNGVIHVVDRVLFPEGFACLLTTAERDGRFSTLLAAAEAAGLTDALVTGGPFTLLAPTDDAFDALPEGALESLLADPQALADVLRGHLIEGTVVAEDVLALDSVETLAGTTLEIANEDGVRIGGAGVIQTDIRAGNGVIHVIDSVLLP